MEKYINGVDCLKTKIPYYSLLTAIGLSSIGDFIYLVAINVLVLKMTGSAAAVAGLWVMAPLAALATKFWAGSVIDRFNRRRLMIAADIARACLVAFIPMLSSVWLVYLLLFLIAMAKAFFDPASMSYITALIPQNSRKKFNSIRSLLTYGAFLVGPAAGGLLLMAATPGYAIWINACSFIISALILSILPDVEIHWEAVLQKASLFYDWRTVFRFSRTHQFIFIVYFTVQIAFVLGLAMDAQEVVFTQQVIGLTEAQYGLLISITGGGAVAGGVILSLVSDKLSIRQMIAFGFTGTALCYLLYSLSFSFLSVAAAFVVLGFANAFLNTGLMTFNQNNIPTHMMGRVSSIYGSILSLFQIGSILLIGLTGDVFPLRYTLITAAICIVLISIGLALTIYQPKRKMYFDEASIEEEEASIK